MLLVIVAIAEFGLAFDDLLTIGYGSREGARVGAALAKGDVTDCSGGADPTAVDATLVGSIQRIIKSPGSEVESRRRPGGPHLQGDLDRRRRRRVS